MEDAEYKTHLFICTNGPDRDGKCGSKNAEDLRNKIKKRCGAAWGKDMRVNASGCLGHCERGIAAVLYPQNKWFLDLKNRPEDEEILFQATKEVMESNM